MVEIVRQRSRRWVGLLLVIVVVSSAIVIGLVVAHSKPKPKPTGPPFDLRTVGTPCHNDSAWVCGSIRVPLDRAAPHTSSLRVRFRVLPRRLRANESAGTIVVVAGGPGAPAMPLYSSARLKFRSLLNDHDLLLVDNRGTGLSEAINCPTVQRSFLPPSVAKCRTLLGSRADDYGTVAAVDDLDAVLTRIHASAVDLYGESYGTYFAQVFALRHPQHLQRMVLDGAVPLDVDPWQRGAIPAAVTALRSVCRATASCRAGGDPVALLRRVVPLVQAAASRPMRFNPGSTFDLARVVAHAGRNGSAYRELPAALRAYVGGDHSPLIRLMNENSVGPVPRRPEPATSMSWGLLLAEACSDEPLPFDLSAPIALQRRQLDSARTLVEKSTAHLPVPFIPSGPLSDPALCLGWPAPTNPPPRSHVTFPNVPTLVLEGALDTVTPPSQAQAVARAFPRGRYVEVPFVGHVAASSDQSGCAASIAAKFLASGGFDRTCLSHIGAPPQVDAFPVTFAQETPIAPIGHQKTTGLAADDLRTVGVVRDAIADVLWDWNAVNNFADVGLRSGDFFVEASAPGAHVVVHLSDIGWTTDTSITGDLYIRRGAQPIMSGSVVVSTPSGNGQLDIRSSHLIGSSTSETITGTVNGHATHLEVDAKLGLF